MLMDAAYLHLDLSMIIHQIRNKEKKINCSYSELLGIVFGVPQGLVLSQLLFNIFLIADIFLIMDDIDIANHADGNTPYVTADDKDGVTAFVENASANLFKCSVIIFSKVTPINATFWLI